MKKLLGRDDCKGKQVAGVKRYDNFVSILFEDDTALVLQTLPDEQITTCRDMSDFDPLDELGLKTEAEIEAEKAEEREERREQFLKLKAEFEPS